LKTKRFFLFIGILFCVAFTQAQNEIPITLEIDSAKTFAVSENLVLDKNIVTIETKDTSQGSLIIKHPKKKWIAALLAFPLPFGVVGLHRIYLGTQPHIPLVYVGTVGGVFGILPLADFIAILNTKEDDLQNLNTGKVFFWIRK
jgi:TM2 domain-containing membrane protein YozV